MKYTISNTFETLGEPVPESFPTKHEAENSAKSIAAEMVGMVRRFIRAADEDEEDRRRIGMSAECDWWDSIQAANAVARLSDAEIIARLLNGPIQIEEGAV